MRFGVQLPTGQEGLINPVPFVRPADFERLARLARDLGYDSLWGNDHLTTQHYVREKWKAAPNYYEVLTTLSVVAASTGSMRLGTSVVVIPMRDIVILAKQLATLDQLTGGRVILGTGIGAYREEFDAVRPEWKGKNRGRIMEEGIDALRRLFAAPSATLHGRYYRFEGVELFPKPVQDPLPIYVGGHTLDAIRRAARTGQGWLPGWRPFEELRDWIQILRREVAAAGRPRDAVEVAPQLAVYIARTHEEAVRRYQASGMVAHRRSLAYTGRDPALAMDNNFVGSGPSILEKVERLRSYGVDHCAAMTFPAATVDEMVEQVQMFAEDVMRPFRGRGA